MKKSNYFNRRKFLAKSYRGIASILLLDKVGKIGSGFNNRNVYKGYRNKIIFRVLGKTGIKIPIVNMGVMNTIDPGLIKSSYEIGVRYFDTAAWYMQGRNEEVLGNTIKKLNIRNKVFIGTKIYIPEQQRNISFKEAKKTYLKIIEESLKRLKTDYVDILYSHSVSTVSWLNNPGILEALSYLKKSGKARFIGLSTHSNMIECITNATSSGFYDVVLTSFNYSFSNDRKYITAMKNAVTKGIGIIAMKTQCNQSWYKKLFEPESKYKYYEGNIIHTALLKWVLRHKFITSVIPGYTSFQQMDEDFSVAYNLEYKPEEKKFLKDRNIKLSMASVCKQCSYCISSCPYGVDIPTLIRAHMYAVNYGNLFLSKNTLDEVPVGRGLDICLSCNNCLANCINNVDISERIGELKLIYG
ncbi:hypothetical protein DRQ09_03780 [candidate division KSB1 bacterium]|nr:MAG: hypothetical protein DRQ09_03780 [candidate division KSB1 bacterium]